LLEPRRQTTTRGRQRHGPEYKVVVPRDEGLARDEQPPPATEVRPPSPAPDLTPSPPEPETGPEVQNSTAGGALSREMSEETTPPRETVEVRQETPPVELGSSPVSVPPSPPLERRQRSRQLLSPAYLKDYIYDCV